MKSGFNRGAAALLAVVVVLLAAAAGVGAWLLVRKPGPQRPEISAYSHGHLIRVGPYQYCNALNLDDCQTPQAQGRAARRVHAIRCSSRYPKPFRGHRGGCCRCMTDPTNTTSTLFRPNSRLAVTIPTVDPQRGRLTGIVVQLLTLVVDRSGELREVPHAEWSVRLNY